MSEDRKKHGKISKNLRQRHRFKIADYLRANAEAFQTSTPTIAEVAANLSAVFSEEDKETVIVSPSVVAGIREDLGITWPTKQRSVESYKKNTPKAIGERVAALEAFQSEINDWTIAQITARQDQADRITALEAGIATILEAMTAPAGEARAKSESAIKTLRALVNGKLRAAPPAKKSDDIPF